MRSLFVLIFKDPVEADLAPSCGFALDVTKPAWALVGGELNDDGPGQLRYEALP